jgi:putative heme iron utilization protein
MISRREATPKQPQQEGRQGIKALISGARKGVLASLIPHTSAPYASLVNVACGPAGSPILLLSRLAWHTQNIIADSRACLLITEESIARDPLEGGRVSLLGRLKSAERGAVQDTYFSVHPTARSYAQFADFSFFTLNVETVHYVAGFGQIVTMEWSQLSGSTH